MWKILLVAVPVLAACPATDPVYTTSGTSRVHPTTAGATGGSTGTTAASSSGTGTGTGSTSGSSTGTTGGAPVYLMCNSVTTNACGDAGIEFTTQAVDALTGAGMGAPTPISSIVQFTNLVDNATADSASDGIVQTCIQPGERISPALVAQGYAKSIYNDLQTDAPLCLPYVPLVAAGDLELLAPLPDYNATTSNVLIVSVADAPFPVRVDECDFSGWSFSLALGDGGLVAAQTAYFSGTSFSPTATATSSLGAAVLYNMDPTIQQVTVIGTRVSNVLDGGFTTCALAQGVNGYTGTIQLRTGYVSSFSFDLADAGD